MARIRSIKPEFWTDEKLTECSLSARLLFIGTWNFADDKGNLQASAKRLKMQIFPADNIDCQPLLDELIAHGLLTEYSVNDEKFLHIKNFAKHQVINRPSKTSIPEPECLEYSVSTHGELTDGKERKGKERNIYIPADFSISERVLKWASEKGHSNLQQHFDNFVSVAKAKGYKYVDWDEAFMNAIRNNWANFQSAPATPRRKTV
jgi:hypothetical protein